MILLVLLSIVSAFIMWYYLISYYNISLIDIPVLTAIFVFLSTYYIKYDCRYLIDKLKPILYTDMPNW